MPEIRAGAAKVDITPAVGLPMGGYGARQGVSTGIGDPLHVRTVVLDDGERRVAIAVCDLVGVSAGLVRQARAIIEAEVGIPGDHVLIAATHTHSGPAGVRSSEAPEYVAETARNVAGSVRLAVDALTPVVLKLGAVDVTTISQNRRDPHGPIEDTARVLLAAPAGGGPAVATLVSYACHSTVFEHDNLDYSADFPGAMCRVIEREVGGTAIYLQGAAGNINPVWMRHDASEVDRVGGVLGAAATRVAHELRPLGEGQWCVNLNWSEDVEKEPAPGLVLDDVCLAAATRTVELSRRAFPVQEAIGKEIASLEEDRKRAIDEGDVLRRRAITARINELRIEWLISGRIAEGGLRPTEQIEVQVIRITPSCVIVGLPGEFFVEIGRDIRERSGRDALLIAGYANGMIGYVPTEEAFADAGYEVGCAQFEPTAGREISDIALDLVAAVDEAARTA